MKKIFIILLTMALAGCSALPNLAFLQSPTPAPVIVNTPRPTVTLIPSPTVDLFVINTKEPTLTPLPGTLLPTDTALSTSTITAPPTITMEVVDIALFTPGPNPFSGLQKSTNQLVWGSTCDGARSIKFIVQVTMPLKRLKYVTLWYRLQDKFSGRHTPWGGGVIMLDNDRGTYFYTVELDQIKDYKFYEDAWLQFQFVASTATRKRLGSSVVDRNSISLTHCKVFSP